MKKSGCAIIALFLAVCASMFVNLLLFAALVGVKGTANVAAVRSLRERDFEEVTRQRGDHCRSEDRGHSAGRHHCAWSSRARSEKTWCRDSRMPWSKPGRTPRSKRWSFRWIARAAKSRPPTCSTTASRNSAKKSPRSSTSTRLERPARITPLVEQAISCATRRLSPVRSA